jgi:hypothetical protein
MQREPALGVLMQLREIGIAILANSGDFIGQAGATAVYLARSGRLAPVTYTRMRRGDVVCDGG